MGVAGVVALMTEITHSIEWKLKVLKGQGFTNWPIIVDFKSNNAGA